MPSGVAFHVTDSTGTPSDLPAETAVAGALPFVSAQADGRIATVPDYITFVGLTHEMQELPGAPTDLPIGYHRIV